MKNVFTVNCDEEKRKIKKMRPREISYNGPKLFARKGPYSFLSKQCDRWLDYFSIFGHLELMKTSPIMSQICQSMLSILPNKK